MARQADSQKLELKRKQKLVQHTQAKNKKKRAAVEKRKQNAAKKAERLAVVELIFDKEEIKKLKGAKLKDHLLAYQNAGASIPKDITIRTVVGQIREALQMAIDSFNAGEWKPEAFSETESSDEETDPIEELDCEEEESDWEEVEE